MSFHLHVLNLRDDATSQDLRQLFSGLGIEDDGVIVIGGPDGEAFVTFESQTDLLQGLRKDGEENLTMKLATDVDKLQAINKVCLEKLEKMHRPDTRTENSQKSRLAKDEDTWPIGSTHGFRDEPMQQKEKQPIGTLHSEPKQACQEETVQDVKNHARYTSQYSQGGPGTPMQNNQCMPLQGGQYMPMQGGPGMQMPGGPGMPMPSWPGMPMPGWPGMPMPSWPGMPLPGWPGMPMPGRPGIQIPSGPGMPPMVGGPSTPTPGGSGMPMQGSPSVPVQGGSAIPIQHGPHTAAPVQSGNVQKDSTITKQQESTNHDKATYKSEMLKRPPVSVKSKDSDSLDEPHSKHQRLSDSIKRTSREKERDKQKQSYSERGRDRARSRDREKSRDRERSRQRDASRERRECRRGSTEHYKRSASRDRSSHYNDKSSKRSQKAIPNALSTRFYGSLFNTLLPGGRATRYYIVTSDLPKDVTASMVWSWVGGPQGHALGVILLKPNSDTPIAFITFENEAARDSVIETSNKQMIRYTDVKTCRYISNIIKNWEGTEKINSPIFETTSSGADREIEICDMDMIAAAFPSAIKPAYAKSGSSHKPHGCSRENTDEQYLGERCFIAIYQMNPLITATKVLSWVCNGLTAYKINFYGEAGPKQSESMAFVLLETSNESSAVEKHMSSKGYITHRLNEASGYQFMVKLGASCMLTEASASGVDRPISHKERKEPPFSAYNFTLNESLHMIYVELKGVDEKSAASEISSWFYGARGVVTVRYRPGLPLVAFVAFATKADCDKAMAQYSKERRGKKFTIQRDLTGTETMSHLAEVSLGNNIKISTLTKQDRKLNPKEEKQMMDIKKFQKSGCGLKAQRQAESLHPMSTSPSFYQLLKTPCTEEKEGLYVVTFKLDRDCTACQVMSWYIDCDPVCTAKVNFFETGPRESEGIGIILVKDKFHRQNAKMLCNQMGKPSSFYKRIPLENLLYRISSLCKISESTSYGHDRPVTVEEVKVVAKIPAFTLVHDHPALFYLHLTGLKSDVTACLIWTWFGGADSLANGVILKVRKASLVAWEAYVALDAYVAFKSEEDCIKAMYAVKQEDKWKSSRFITERLVLQFIATSSVDLMIKVSSNSGQDRRLDPDEQKMLASLSKRYDPVSPYEWQLSKRLPALQMSSSLLASEMPKKPTAREIYSGPKKTTARQIYSGPIARQIPDNVAKISTQSQEKEDFYIQLTRVPTEMSACELLAWYTADGGTGISATLIRDPSGVSMSAYIKFAEGGHRDAAISRQQFSKPCTAHTLRLQLAELEPDYQVLKSTETGKDRIMTEDERLSFRSASSASQNGVSTNSAKNFSATTYDEHMHPVCEALTQQISSNTTSMQIPSTLHTNQSDKMPVPSQTQRSTTESLGGTQGMSMTAYIGGKQPGLLSPALQKNVPRRKGCFYIRLRRVPADVTACEVLSWYTADGGHGKSATLIRDADGKGLFAYVMFEEDEHRQSAMTTRQFSKVCTARARATCLAELSLDHLVLESIGFSDRCLTMDEREALQNEFDSQYGVAKKVKKLK